MQVKKIKASLVSFICVLCVLLLITPFEVAQASSISSNSHSDMYTAVANNAVDLTSLLMIIPIAFFVTQTIKHSWKLLIQLEQLRIGSKPSDMTRFTVLVLRYASRVQELLRSPYCRHRHQQHAQTLAPVK